MNKATIILLYSFFLLCLATGCAPGKGESATSTLDEKIPLIFSHDGAPDDIATLVYLAKHPSIELLGVIQSYGEQHPSESIDEWQIFLYEVIDDDDAVIAVGSEIPVDPYPNEFPKGWRTSADDFWGMYLPEKTEDYEADVGHELIIDLVKNSPEKVTILVTGAETDMALALQEDASIVENISQIVIMGGAFNVDGNLYESPGYEGNHVAEWNIFVDPLAAKIVFNSGVPLSIVPLDGSDNFYITAEDPRKLRGNDDAAVQLVYWLWKQNVRWWNGDFKIWDIVASVVVTNPEFFTWTYDGVDVIDEPGDTHGQTITLGNGSQITRFASDTDYEKVHKKIFEVFQ